MLADEYTAKSPVWYKISLSSLLYLNFSSVSCVLSQYPLATHSPAIHNSPGIPTPHIFPLLTIYIFVFLIGLPIGTCPKVSISEL